MFFVLFVGATIRSLDFLITGHASISMKQIAATTDQSLQTQGFARKTGKIYIMPVAIPVKHTQVLTFISG